MRCKYCGEISPDVVDDFHKECKEEFENIMEFFKKQELYFNRGEDE